jgi:hypothetical protein
MFTSSLESTCERGVAAARRFLHHDESAALQMPHKPPRDDLRHEFVGIVDALAALEAQREREGVGDVFGRGGRQLVVGHDRL